MKNNLYILEDEFKTKEAFNVLLKYNRYDLLTHSSEEVLLETLPNGKKLYEELIEKGYGINTESIVNDEIARKIIETEDEKLLRCLGAECLLSLYDLNRTYLDVILDKAVETKKKSLVGNLRFEDATTNEEAKIIISHVNHGLSGMLADLTLEKLLDDSSGTTLLEELLREDEEITLKLLNNEIKSDLEVATILKLHGIKQKRLKYDSELSPKMKEQYISATLDVYKNMPITEEEEEVLQNFFNVMSDGQTPIEIIDMIDMIEKGACAAGGGIEDIGTNPIPEGYAGDNDLRSAEHRHLFRQLARVGLGLHSTHGGGVAPGTARQEAGLGEVGGNDVRFLAQAAHSRLQLVGISGIQLAVVAHNGIDHHAGAALPLTAEAVDEIGNDADLTRTAEKAAVNGVKGQRQCFKMVGDALHRIGEIDKMHSRKAAGMGRKQCGRQGDTLQSHDREGRHDDGQRTASEAGQVMNGGDAGNAGGGGVDHANTSSMAAATRSATSSTEPEASMMRMVSRVFSRSKTW